jgi:hypothetical protein
VLSACALAVLAPWPAAGPTLAFLQLLLGPANATFSGHLLFGILDPADELVSGQRRDVLPGIECRGVCAQRLAQVSWKFVYHSTRQSRTAHSARVQRLKSARNDYWPAKRRAVMPDPGRSGMGRRRPSPPSRSPWTRTVCSVTSRRGTSFGRTGRARRLPIEPWSCSL